MRIESDMQTFSIHPTLLEEVENKDEENDRFMVQAFKDLNTVRPFRWRFALHGMPGNSLPKGFKPDKSGVAAWAAFESLSDAEIAFMIKKPKCKIFLTNKSTIRKLSTLSITSGSPRGSNFLYVVKSSGNKKIPRWMFLKYAGPMDGPLWKTFEEYAG